MIIIVTQSSGLRYWKELPREEEKYKKLEYTRRKIKHIEGKYKTPNMQIIFQGGGEKEQRKDR